jgi:hypothetical protein
MIHTQAEIEEAAVAIRDVEDKDEPASEFMPHARAALEAAARAREPISVTRKELRPDLLPPRLL